MAGRVPKSDASTVSKIGRRSRKASKKDRPRRQRRLFVESLEDRLLLSATRGLNGSFGLNPSLDPYDSQASGALADAMDFESSLRMPSGASTAVGDDPAALRRPVVDHVAGTTLDEPSRVVLQWIGGRFHRWHEYEVGDRGQFSIALVEPESRPLSAEEAQRLLTASAGWRVAPAELPDGQLQVLDVADVLLAATDVRFFQDGDDLFSPESVIGEDDRVRVSWEDVQQFPWYNVGYQRQVYPNDDAYRCTAFLVTPHVTLTNGHCVFDSERGGYAETVQFAPGQFQEDTGTPIQRPFGYHAATAWETNPTYETDPADWPAHDYAAVFYENSFDDLGIGTYVPLVFNVTPSFVQVTGYPGTVHEESNLSMWTDVGNAQVSSDSRVLHYQADTSSGNSGGPVWQWVDDQPRVVGIHSFGATTYNGGPRLTDHNLSLIEQWMQWMPPVSVIQVDTLDDVVDPNDGLTSLREAIILANAQSDPVEILLQPGTYTLTRTGANEKEALTGDLDILEGREVTIVGAGAGQTIIDAGGLFDSDLGYGDRVFDVQSGASLTIVGVTLTGGATPIPGIQSDRSGGAIRNISGTVNVVASAITGNTADFHGGGVFNAGTGTLTVTASTISGNTATTGSGGGIQNNSTVSKVTVTNSTISGNVAAGHGGGIRDFGVTTIEHSTITGNRADANDSGSVGGGIATVNSPAVLQHSIVAGNFKNSGVEETDSDIEGDNLDSGSSYNLVGDPATAGGLAHGSNGNILGRSDGVGGRELIETGSILVTTLADNGGPTATHALVSGSPAIHAGDPSFDNPELPYDQRGIGFSRVNLGRIDIGAVEFVAFGLSQNFDDVSVPSLPPGWTSVDAFGAVAWTTSATDSSSPPNSAFVPNFDSVSDVRLTSPTFMYTEDERLLTFQNLYNTEAGYDGGALEISVAGGDFEDILAAGGSFLSGGYNSSQPLPSAWDNPLAGRHVWTGNSNGFIDTAVQLPLSAADQPVQLRWRLGTDEVISAPGWWIDDVSVEVQTGTPDPPPVDGEIHVTTFADVIDPNDGLISLREAIRTANQIDDDVTILLSAGTYTLSISGSNEDEALTGDLDILPGGSVTIVGAGAGQTVIDASGLGDRVFQVHAGASVEIEGVTITGGTIPASGEQRFGGGILNEGELWLTDSELIGNAAPGPESGYQGAGLANDATGIVTIIGGAINDNSANLGGGVLNRGQMSITGTLLSSNSAVGLGGAVYNSGPQSSLVISNSTLTGNAAPDGGDVYVFSGQVEIVSSTIAGNSAIKPSDPLNAAGGGLVVWLGGDVSLFSSTVADNSAMAGGGIFSVGTLNVSHSTISGNVAGNFGGGIAAAGSLTVINSTISGNAAMAGGGGIGIDGGAANVLHSTVFGNVADSNGNGVGNGGGILVASGDLALHHTIVAGNTRGDAAPQDDDIAGAVDAASAYNLIGDGESAGGLSDAIDGNIVGVDGQGVRPSAEILELELGDHGGPTLTHALAVSSAAIDAGDPDFDPELFDPPLVYDQRGEGFERVMGDRIDIGAFEIQVFPLTLVQIVDGNLVVEDIAADGKDDRIVISLSGENIRVHDPNHSLSAGSGVTQVDPFTVEVSLAAVSGQILVQSLAGDDLLTVDFSGGNPIPAGGLSYDGGDGQDALSLVGGAFHTSRFTYVNASEGSIELDTDGDGETTFTISYTGLAPITSSIASDVVELIYTGGDETITVADAGGSQTLAESTLGEATTFVNPTDELRIFATNGSDTIHVNSLAAGYASLVIQGDDVTDVVNFSGPLTFAADHGLMVSNVGTVNVSFTSVITTSGSGAVSLSAIRNIMLWTNSSLTTVDGGITLLANADGTTTGNFSGIVAIGATIETTGSGDISLSGFGADNKNAQSNQHGVYMHFGTIVRSTATGADAGTIAIDGTGGTGTNSNRGVLIRNPGTQVSSVDGAILITGQGGDGFTSNDHGVNISDAAVISSTGTGSEAATITIDGTGGGRTSSNPGVLISGSGSSPGTQVTSVDGAILITGRGGDGTGSSNGGVNVWSGAIVSSTGTGSDAATITINGIGGTGTNSNRGVLMMDSGTQVTSFVGNILVTGQGGDGSGHSNLGVQISGAAFVSSKGEGADAAKITIHGSGGTGTNDNRGVYLWGLDSRVRSVEGDIQITGTAGGGDSFAIELLVSGAIEATGTADVTLVGDSMDIAAANAIAAGANTVALRPVTAGTSIDLGGPDAPGTLGLADAELDRIAAGRLVIGDTSSGAIMITAPITRPAATDVDLVSGEAIVFDPGSIDTAGGDLLLAPGTVVRPLTAGADVAAATVSFADGAQLAIRIDGTTVDTEYSQLNVTGAVDLTGAALMLSGSYSPAVGDAFTIVDNGGSDPIVGTFTGLPEGAVIPDFLGSGLVATITYVGGDGNDVVLEVQAAEAVGVQVVAVAAPSPAGSTALPSSLEMVARGSTYYVEVWVQDLLTPGVGISGGNVDVNYTTAVADAVNVFNLDFDMFPDGVIDDPNGLVKDLGGGTMEGGRGIAPQWARLGYVEFVATELGPATFELGSGGLPFSRFGVGNVPWDLVDLGTTIVVDQIGGARIDMTIVHEPSAIGDNGEVVSLPDSADWVHEWQSFWVEIWVSTPETATLGVAGATLDLQYYADYVTAMEIVHGPAFNVNPSGTIDDGLGLVSGIGGGTELTDVGDDAYVLLARVRFASTGDDQVPVDAAGRNIGPYDMELTLASGQTDLVDVGPVVPELGGSPATELWAVVYDIDDNNQIDFGDFSFFAAAFGKTVGAPDSEPPYVWWADFDKSGRIDFGDLAFFAPNFGKTRAAVQSGQQTLIFPPNFPNAWRAEPAEPGGEGEAMDGGDVLQPSFAGAGTLAGFDSLQESRTPSLHAASAAEQTHAFGRQEQPTTGLGARVPAAADAMFARLGTAEAERTPPWLRSQAATTGHESARIEASPPSKSPVTLHFRSEPSVAAPAERPHRWSEHWEPLEDLLSLLADEPNDRAPDPHDALFAPAGGDPTAQRTKSDSTGQRAKSSRDP